jgi:Protein of unknown function (DUF3551)
MSGLHSSPMIIVIRSALAATCLLTALSLSAAPARAGLYGEAPWCAVVSTGTGDVHWDCQYRTAEQCAPNVIAGNRGSCTQNPYFVPGASAARAWRHYR